MKQKYKQQYRIILNDEEYIMNQKEYDEYKRAIELYKSTYTWV